MPTSPAAGLLTLPSSPVANLRRVRVHRAPEKEGIPGLVETLNVEELLRTNDREKDLVLQPGDGIEVSEKLL